MKLLDIPTVRHSPEDVAPAFATAACPDRRSSWSTPSRIRDGPRGCAVLFVIIETSVIVVRGEDVG